MKKWLLFSALTAAIVFAVYTLYLLNTPKLLTNADYISWKMEKKKNAKPNYGNPDEAMKWFYEQRAYPDGKIPDGWREEALEHIRKNNISSQKGGVEGLAWTQVGPGNYGGRLRSIVVHPTDPNIIYIGSVSGGVWKTTNGGGEWTALKDAMENLAVCSMVMDPTNPNIIYAGTGEGYFNSDAQRGEGIFKTTDGGATWTQLSSTKNSSYYYVNKLVFDNTTNLLYAGTRKGLFKSSDGGTTFTTLLSGTGGGDVHCSDIEIAYTSPTTIYASFGLFNDAAIMRSVDGGSSFSANFSQAGHGRVEMAVSASNPLVAYAAFNDLSTSGVSLMIKTTNGGSSWSSFTPPGPSYAGATNYAGTQAWYDNILAVDPSNANIVFAGGIDFWKSTNGGTSWTQKTNWYEYPGAPQYVHADHHAIVFAPSNANLMFLGTDGGIYLSTNKGENWTSKNNNLTITQFYYGAIGPNGDKYFGGTQDNGTLKSNSGSTWSEILGGDGGATEVDFNNPNNIYMEYVQLAIFKSTDGGASFFSSMNGIPKGPGLYDGTTDRSLFISPFAMDPNDPQKLVAGTYRVYRTVNGANNWSTISSDLTGDGSGSSGATISALEVAKGNSSIIYAATSNGRVQVTTDAGGSWNLRNGGLPAAYITKVKTDPNNPATAFVTFSGFSAGQKIFKTTNYGQSWSNITGNLPNLPTNSLFVSPADVNNIYVGTDLGLFVTTNNGSSWVQDTNLPNVNIMDIDFRASDNRLVAATHGRSMYAATIGGSSVTTVDLIYDDGSPYGGYYWQSANQASANRITPTLSNAKVIKMSIYINGVNAGSASYTPIVLSNSGGQPGGDLVVIPKRTAASYPGWDETDLSSYNIMVNGDFFVGLKYDGINQPTYGYDQSNNGRAWDYNGTSWSAWGETYFMRATIQTITSVVEIDTRVPETFYVSQNYPNPFNPSTTIRYSLPGGENVSVDIFDITGERVAQLVNNYQAAGTYSVAWNGKNDFGIDAASGTYIISVRAGNFAQNKKMVLLR